MKPDSDSPKMSADPPAQTNASTTREPDPDTIKMFVGQVPRSWGEKECRELFEQFGSVYQLNVLRDKTTQVSRGCCFVTFYRRVDAISAQAALHNIRILPQMHHPVQMKPADCENRNERKLFVGMINKRLSEDDVKEMFEQFGHIEDCTVLKDADGKSRGCAFVTFSNRSYAQQAIRQMHQSLTMEGCSTPIVVKFADTQKEKEAKKSITVPSSTSPTVQNTTNIAASIQQLLQNAQNASLAAPNTTLGTQLNALATLLQSSGQPNVLSLLGNANVLQQQQQHLLQLQHNQRILELFQQQQLGNNVPIHQSTADLSANYFTQSHPSTIPINFNTSNNESPTLSTASFMQGASPTDSKQNFMLANGGNNLIQLTGASGGAQTNLEALQQAYLQQYAASFPQLTNGAMNGQVPSQLLLNTNAVTPSITTPSSSISLNNNSIKPLTASNQSKGPDGCNLFIYHLPQDFTDSDLITTFSPFGNILSAKVFIDKQTNLSKCFGFVSYDNAISAKNAISALNGFQIGSKRLKVQLKRGKDAKPYSYPSAASTANDMQTNRTTSLTN